jgi:hypothetical protein
MGTETKGWLACGLAAALFLAPAVTRGGLGPADLLLSMTPWSQYRDRFPDVSGVHNPQLDVIQQYVPWRMFAADSLRHGQLPLWNPHAYCGQPFVGNVLSAVFYPFTWLATIMPIGRFFLLSAWFHLTLLGGGMWLLLRDHKLCWYSALGGALAMMFNPFVVGWLQFTVLSQWTLAWLPLTVWAWRRAWTMRRPGRLVWPALTLALAMLGGHLQIAFYVGLGWALYAVAMILMARRPRDLLLYVAAPAALAMGLAALQIAPALEMARFSGRGQATYDQAVASALPLRSLVQLVAPWFYGRNTFDYWGFYGGNAIEASLGTGAAALWLAVAGLAAWRRQPTVRALALIAAVALSLALGTPLYWLAWRFVPGFKALSGLPRAMCLWGFAAAALTGFGIEALAGEGGPRRALGLTALAGTAGALLLAWLGEALRAAPNVVTAFSDGRTGYVAWQSVVALAAAAAVGHVAFHGQRRAAPWLVAVVAAELVVLGFSESTGLRPDAFFFRTPEIDYLTSRPEPFRMVGLPGGRRPAFLDWMPMNTPLAYGLSSPSGSESLSFGPYRAILAAFCEPGWEPKLGSPLLNLAGVRYVLSTANLEGVQGLRRVAGERVGVFENPAALPMAFLTRRWRRLQPAAQAEAVTQADFDPAEALVTPDAPPCPIRTQDNNGSTILNVTRPSPQRWTAEGVAPGPGLALLTQSRVPGWRAFVNAQPAPLYAADAVFTAAAVPAGALTVRWVWISPAFALGLFVSLMAVALGTAWLTAGRNDVGRCGRERVAAGTPDP